MNDAIIGQRKKKLRKIIGGFREKAYLCSDFTTWYDKLYPTAQAAAMAQERFRLCTDILQQQLAEA